MSQFSRKYYKNDYKLEEGNEVPLRRDYDDTVWTFWRVWGLYEYLVLILLGVIIFLLLNQHTTAITTDTSYKKQTLSGTYKENKKLQESQFAKKILPANPLPKKLDGTNLYGPLTMEEYLYFADDVDSFYPDFFDKKSRKSIDGASCKTSSCPLTPKMLDEMRMAAYTQWLTNTTGIDYTFFIKDNHYYIKQR